MIKRFCDVCDEEMPEDYEPIFIFTHEMRKFKVLMMLADDDDDEEGSGPEDICHDCAKEALENTGFIEDEI